METENEPGDKVLIVDDDDDTRPALERSLRRLGYETQAAADGEEGLRLAMEGDPAVILADLRMPKMDGHTLLRRLKAQDLDAAVVVMSGHGTMDDVVDALRNGAVDYLKKPWTTSELGAAVGRAAEISGRRRAFRQRQQSAAQEPWSAVPKVRTSTSPGVPSLAPVRAPIGSSLPASPANSTASAPAPQTAPPNSQSASPTPQALTERVFASVLEQLRRGELALPAVPRVLADLRALISEPNASIDAVVSLIELDQRTALQAVRLANSVQYSGLTRVADIRAAVNRVGFRQIENIVETSFALSCCRITDPRFRPSQLKIWKYSVARGVAMRALGDMAGPLSGVNPAIAYLAGLMSDAGATLLLWLIAERERMKPSADPEKALADCLESIRGHHHELGAMLLRSWGLDPAVIFIAATHHDETPPPAPNPYWSLSVLGLELANQLAPGDDITRSQPVNPALLDRAAAELRIANSSIKRTLAKLSREVEAIFETLA
jgi:HD-like signal output (HDOD) protein/FixJ family two-component response regulator